MKRKIRNVDASTSCVSTRISTTKALANAGETRLQKERDEGTKVFGLPTAGF